MHAHAPCSRLIIHGAGAQEGDRNFPIPSSYAHKTPFLRHTHRHCRRFAFLGVSRRQPFTLYTMQAVPCLCILFACFSQTGVNGLRALVYVRSQLAMLLL